MILYSLVKERIEARQKQRETDAIKLADREWLQWNARRKAAEAAGERFTEPTPAEKRNGATESD